MSGIDMEKPPPPPPPPPKKKRKDPPVKTIKIEKGVLVRFV
jgi:hypothetical protein